MLSNLSALEVEWDNIVSSVDPEVGGKETSRLVEGDKLLGSVELINAK